jgi:hypothetical protein
MPASVIDRFPASRRNELMERISRNARRLRQGIGANGVVDLTLKGRNDSLEQLLVRLGVIPIVVLPNATSLTGTFQAWSGRRPSTSENISVLGATAGTSFVVGDPAKSVAFTAGGNGQALTATDSVDAAAKGRALINIAP